MAKNQLSVQIFLKHYLQQSDSDEDSCIHDSVKTLNLKFIRNSQEPILKVSTFLVSGNTIRMDSNNSNESLITVCMIIQDREPTWILSSLSSSSCLLPEVSALSANFSLACDSHWPKSRDFSLKCLWSATFCSHFFRLSYKKEIVY